MAEVTRFGKYELGTKLSSGGMAITYRATLVGAHGVKKAVVLKLIHPGLVDNAELAELFISEARLSAQLTHGNIAQVFDFGEVEGTYFIAMELVEGHSLADVLKMARKRGAGAIPEPLCMQVGIEMCEALHYAHTANGDNGQPLNVVHRDVSPENVMLAMSGEVKLLDFGIAKSIHNKLRTETGMVRGKYPYFSPEQAQADSLDARTDIWATGVVLYEMLCQRRPFEGEFVDVMRQLVNGDFPLPSSFNPGISKDFEDIILKALAYERNARWRTAREMGQALAKFLHATHPTAHRSDLQWLLLALFGADSAHYAKAVREKYPGRKELATPHAARPSAPTQVPGGVAPRSSKSHKQSDLLGPTVVKTPKAKSGKSAPKPDKTMLSPEPFPEPTTEATGERVPPVNDEDEPNTDADGDILPVSGKRAPGRPQTSLDTPELKKKRAQFVRGVVAVVSVLIVGVLGLAVWKLNSGSAAEDQQLLTPVWVSSTPAGALVMLDGQEVGRTPFQGFVPLGPHTFGMALKGYRPWSKRLTMQSATRVPVDAKLIPEGGDVPVEAPHPGTAEANANNKPITQEPDASVVVEKQEDPYERHWPLRLFTVKAELHTVVALDKPTARIELDPKTAYQVTVNGRLSYAPELSTNTFLMLLEGDNVPDKERLTWFTKSRRVSGATALRLFVFDDNPDDNEGKVSVTLFKTKYEPSKVIMLKPQSLALAVDPKERMRVTQLDPTHRYVLTFHAFDAKVGKGAPHNLFCIRESPEPETVQHATLMLPFTFDGEMTGIKSLECFFLDLNPNKSAGEIQVDFADRTLEEQGNGG
jgi:serine/threonine protein kinase